MKDSDYKLLEIKFKQYGIGETLKYYDKLKANEAICEEEDTMLNKDYCIVLDAIIEEYNEKNGKVQHLTSENVIKRIPQEKRYKNIHKSFISILNYLNHYGYFNDYETSPEAGNAWFNPSSKALYYKETQRKQVKNFIFRDVIVPLVSAAIGALATIVASA